MNYMQLDTNRLEHVAHSIHTVWDGALQVRVINAVMVIVISPVIAFVLKDLRTTAFTVCITYIFCVVLQITGYTLLLLQFLGPSVFAGIAAMLVILPLNAYFLRK